MYKDNDYFGFKGKLNFIINSIYFIPIFNIYLISIFLSITVRLDQKRNKNHRIIEKQYVTIIYYIFN